MTSSRTPTVGAPPSTRQHLGRVCWRWPTWAIAAANCKTPREAGKQYQPGASGLNVLGDQSGHANPNQYRPLQGYGDLNLATNNLYSNYNALQVTWARHAGLYTIQANYTWQKALGIVSPTINPFNLAANYGVEPTDRRQLFNAAYSIDLGNRVEVNPL